MLRGFHQHLLKVTLYSNLYLWRCLRRTDHQRLHLCSSSWVDKAWLCAHTIKSLQSFTIESIVHLEPPQWMRSVLSQVIKMQPHLLVARSQQRVRPSTEVTPVVAWRNFQKSKDKKNTQNNIPRDMIEKYRRDLMRKIC